MNGNDIPAPEKTELHLGYVRLTDSAPFIIALEQGFFAALNLDVYLHQEVSWANVRDKLAAGALDAAQMLAPLAAMTSLGVSGLRVPMLSGLTCSLNGNAITLSTALLNEMGLGAAASGIPPAAANARRLGIHLRSRSKPLCLGVVHAFSTHAILLRAWLQAGGIDPDRQIRTLVIPPSQMPDSMASGVIDGYCAGEPWNTMAVQYGLGHMVALGNQIWERAPEKVLAVTERWHQHHPSTHLRLRMALMQAGAWLTIPANRATVATTLSQPDYLDLPQDRLQPSLSGNLACMPGAPPVSIRDFHVFDSKSAGLPSRASLRFTIERCAELLGRPIAADRISTLVRQTCRPDLFHEAARKLGWPDEQSAPSARTGSDFALK